MLAAEKKGRTNESYLLEDDPARLAYDELRAQFGRDQVMVITLEPGMEFAPGQMMVHEENIVIREDGAELLTRRAPPEMSVL